MRATNHTYRQGANGRNDHPSCSARDLFSPLILVAVATVLAAFGSAQQPAPGVPMALATTEQLAQKDAVVEARARDLVFQLRDDLTVDSAFTELLRLRPLPSSAVSLLISRVTQTTKKDKAAVRRSALVLAYHERMPEQTLAAIMMVRKKLKNQDPVATILDAASEYLTKAVPTQRMAVLADSDQFEELILAAISKGIKPPPETPRPQGQTGRSGMVTTFSSRSWGPQIEDLPLNLILNAGASECGVTLGWEWRFQESEMRTPTGWSSASRRGLIEPPQIGALARINQGALRLDHAVVSAGAILRRTSQGWSPIGGDEAVKLLVGSLKVPKINEVPDHVGLAILGTAVMGSTAVSAIPDLIERGLQDPQWARRAAVAMEKIGDKAALPGLRQMNNRYAGQSWVRETIDPAITGLERLP